MTDTDRGRCSGKVALTVVLMRWLTFIWGFLRLGITWNRSMNHHRTLVRQILLCYFVDEETEARAV